MRCWLPRCTQRTAACCGGVLALLCFRKRRREQGQWPALTMASPMASVGHSRIQMSVRSTGTRTAQSDAAASPATPALANPIRRHRSQTQPMSMSGASPAEVRPSEEPIGLNEAEAAKLREIRGNRPTQLASTLPILVSASAPRPGVLVSFKPPALHSPTAVPEESTDLRI